MSEDDDILLIQLYLDSGLDARQRQILLDRVRGDQRFCEDLLTAAENANLARTALQPTSAASMAQAVLAALRLKRNSQRTALFTTVQGRIDHGQRLRWGMRLVAAAVVLIALGGWWAWHLLSTDAGERAEQAIDTIAVQDVEFGDHSRLRFAPGSRGTVRRAADGVLCRLERGSVEAEIVSQADGHSVRIETAHAMVRVVGTHFSVTTGLATRVEVDEGLVEVRQRDGTSCHVPGGFVLQCDGNGPMVPLASVTRLAAAPRLGVTWGNGADALVGPVFNLLATKQRHWSKMGEPADSRMEASMWGWSDQLYGYAAAQRIPVLQNAFFWSDYLGSGQLDARAARQAATEWTIAFSKRYSDRLHWWEVVDEPAGLPGYATMIGGAGESGCDWLVWLYRLARAHAPRAELLLGGLGLSSSRSDSESFAHRARVLRDCGLLDGLVLRGHAFQHIDPAQVREQLDRLAQIAVPLYIDEFDIDEADDQVQREDFEQNFPMIWRHPAIRGVVFWGDHKGATLRANDHLVDTSGGERPALRWLRGYLAQDALRLELARGANARGLTIPLTIRPGYAAAGLTRIEVVLDGISIADCTALPAIVELPRSGPGLHALVVRGFSGARVVEEATRAISGK